MTTIQHRRGTAAQWVAANPVLAAGEFGVEVDTGEVKVGDGVTAWDSLAYQMGAPGPPGPAGEIVSASATTLPPGSDATITLGGTPSARDLVLGIPGGIPGDTSAAEALAADAAAAAEAVVDARFIGAHTVTASIVGSEMFVDIPTNWGIDAEGWPYYDDTNGPADGEAALFFLGPDGASWVPLSEVI